MKPLQADTKNSYDEVPYKSHPFAESHPDRLATLGRLFGLAPAPVTGCRVLELGCASGGNLIPMAYQLPGSEFVGVDLSIKQVEMAHKAISDLGLNNIHIENASILDIDASWGVFDYVICHGVYSWAPANVRDKILAVAVENLAPHGVSYISYNTYPGWHMREMIRHMMCYHADQFEDTGRRIAQARALVDFLAGAVSTHDYYGWLLKSELDLIKGSPDWYLFHDHLEAVNAPIYFYQFIEQAEKHGLQYLAEANFSTMLTSGFAPEIAGTLKEISPNIIRTEQYMDFLRNRFFRQTLLCHKDLPLNRALGAESLNGFLVTSSLRPEPGPADLSPGIKQSFRTLDGLTISTDFPLTKAALTILGELWPRAIDVKLLYKTANQRLMNVSFSAGAEHDWNLLRSDLLHCYTASTIELHTWQADFIVQVNERPKISKLAAYQATQGCSIVNQRHEVGEVDIFGRELAGILDGSRDRTALLEYLRQRISEGALAFKQDGNPVADRAILRNLLENALDETLQKFAISALLVES